MWIFFPNRFRRGLSGDRMLVPAEPISGLPAGMVF
jgi:hypothetical protein